jgi:hypothetical protein
MIREKALRRFWPEGNCAGSEGPSKYDAQCRFSLLMIHTNAISSAPDNTKILQSALLNPAA